jgi:hypothetical protein
MQLPKKLERLQALYHQLQEIAPEQESVQELHALFPTTTL